MEPGHTASLPTADCCWLQMVGAGVLGLPFAMKYLLWPAGTVLMIFSWATTIYTQWQMCAMHEVKGRRFNRYHELGQFAFGEQGLIVLNHLTLVQAGDVFHHVLECTLGAPACMDSLSGHAPLSSADPAGHAHGCAGGWHVLIKA